MTGNIQYLRTERAIQSAMLSLLDKKPFEKITVRNILDEASVSRATFYKHFRDKYDIVEKIQDEVLHSYQELRESMTQTTPDQYPALVEQFTQRYRETCQLLMRVQTERVNLPLALAGEYEAYYLSTSSSPTRKLEAKIYAAAVTAMMVALLDEMQEYPLENTFDAMIAVGLRMMGLPNDPELKKQIIQRRKMTVC